MKQIAEKLGVGYVVEGRRAQRWRSHAHHGAAQRCGQQRHRLPQKGDLGDAIADHVHAIRKMPTPATTAARVLIGKTIATSTVGLQ
jgi:hypothetical protein